MDRLVAVQQTSFVCMGKKKGDVRGDKVFFKSKLKSAVE
jgi:hypothetical protein